MLLPQSQCRPRIYIIRVSCIFAWFYFFLWFCFCSDHQYWSRLAKCYVFRSFASSLPRSYSQFAESEKHFLKAPKITWRWYFYNAINNGIKAKEKKHSINLWSHRKLVCFVSNTCCCLFVKGVFNKFSLRQNSYYSTFFGLKNHKLQKAHLCYDTEVDRLLQEKRWPRIKTRKHEFGRKIQYYSKHLWATVVQFNAYIYIYIADSCV